MNNVNRFFLSNYLRAFIVTRNYLLVDMFEAILKYTYDHVNIDIVCSSSLWCNYFLNSWVFGSTFMDIIDVEVTCISERQRHCCGQPCSIPPGWSLSDKVEFLDGISHFWSQKGKSAFEILWHLLMTSRPVLPHFLSQKLHFLSHRPGSLASTPTPLSPWRGKWQSWANQLLASQSLKSTNRYFAKFLVP